MINCVNSESIYNLICLEKLYLNTTLDSQKLFNSQLLFVMQFCAKQQEFANPSQDFLDQLQEVINNLNLSKQNISLVTELLGELSSLPSDYRNNSVNKKINLYNCNFVKDMAIVYRNTEVFQNFLNDFTNQHSLDLQNFYIDNKGNQSTSKYPENTLIISELQSKVILPFKINKLENILLTNQESYKSIEDIIEKLYTIPINNYKFSSSARFREAYKLITEREHGSKASAISLGIELLFNYNLHPAIITACKTLDELDIYLACLETNTLSDFHFFDIKYEIPPALKNKK